MDSAARRPASRSHSQGCAPLRVKSRARVFVFTLWIQIVLVCLVVSLVLSLIVGNLVSSYESGRIEQDLAMRNERTVAILTATSLDALITEDVPVLQSVVEQITRLDPDIGAIAIENGVGQLLIEWTREKADINGPSTIFSKDAVLENEVFGKVTIRWNTEALIQQVNVHSNRVRLITEIILMALGIVIIFAVQWLITRPIGKVHGGLQDLAKGKPMPDLALPWYTARELAGLGDAVKVLERTLASEQVQREKLRGSEKRFRDIADATSDWFWEMDENLRFTFISERYFEVTGDRPEFILGKSREDLKIPGLDPQVWQKHLADLAARRPFRNFRHPRSRPCGRVIQLSLNGKAVFDDAGEFFGYRGTGTDVTAEVEAKEEVEVAEAQFRQAQKMEAVGQLTAGIAHDFNNLLMIIDGYANRAKMKSKNQEVLLASIDEVLEASGRGAKLIKQLLTFSRRQIVEKSVFPIGEKLGALEHLLRRSIGELYEFCLDLHDPQSCIETDAGEFDQAILNLVINARDATERGGAITIRTAVLELRGDKATAFPDITPGPFIRISVIDEGTGISEEDLQRVFEPFFTTKEQGKGTGLGLAMVYGFVRQSGGMADIESTPGEGTTVHLYLPVVERPSSSAAVEVEVEVEAQGRGETILLVEDNEALLSLLKDTVMALGYVVLTAHNGFAALEVDNEHDGVIDLLLSDVVMPSMGGPEVAQVMCERRPNMRVVLMSGYPARARQEVDIPVDTLVLHKPVKVSKLAAAIRQELDLNKIDASLTSPAE